MLVAAVLSFVAGVVFAPFHPFPDIESARYLLSTIPQVIGAVFVLTLVVIQIVGVGGRSSLWDLLKRCDVKFAFIISLIGIVVPLILLNFNFFFLSTTICLGLGVANLFIIGWLIWRLAPLVVTGKLDRLKRSALADLKVNKYSDTVKKSTEIGEQAVTHNEKGMIIDVIFSLESIVQSEDNNSKDVWEAYARSLVKLNSLGKTFVRPYLKVLLERVIITAETGQAQCIIENYLNPTPMRAEDHAS